MRWYLPAFFPYIFLIAVQTCPVPDSLVHQGVATWYYDADVTQPACGFEWPSDGAYYCAINTPDLHTEGDSARACGAYVHVESDEASIECPVIDECPWPQWCDDEQIDFSPWAFMALVSDTTVGVIDITWWYISGTMSDPFVYYFQEGSNEYWLSLQIRNHTQAIKTLEIKSGGSWHSLKRTSYNFFVIEDGAGNGPFEFRVTATTDEVITDSGVQLSPGNEVPGTKNFTQTAVNGSSMKHGFTGPVKTHGIDKVFMVYGRTFKVPSSCFATAEKLEIYSLQGKLITSISVEKSHIVELPESFAQRMWIVRAKGFYQ